MGVVGTRTDTSSETSVLGPAVEVVRVPLAGVVVVRAADVVVCRPTVVVVRRSVGVAPVCRSSFLGLSRVKSLEVEAYRIVVVLAVAARVAVFGTRAGSVVVRGTRVATSSSVTVSRG